MSRSTKDYEIGRGRPPKATQWKKGKSANPGGLSSRSVDVAETIDKLLLTPVKITVNGDSKRVAALKVILEQLWNKGIEGDRRAMAVFFRWLELAPQVADRTVEITFADSEYTRTFTGQSIAGSPGNE
ncbi:DUF5681 domain-containing protein [Bradyrhizobium sp.]|jgi:hypothetical protein|uniref:DUF5681 domain-containing protein n=1 Tax=Bradyrhizobium sp. TaxID=376 RepID=UPI003C164121